VLWKWLIS